MAALLQLVDQIEFPSLSAAKEADVEAPFIWISTSSCIIEI